MLKKSIYFSFLFVFALAFTFSSLPSNSAFAKDQSSSNGEELSPNTVITKDNIYRVLDYFGIDSNNFIMYKIKEQDPRMTVQEFSEHLKQVQKQPKEVTLENPISLSPFIMTPGPGGGGSSSGKGAATISKNWWTSNGYSLTLIQTGFYNHGLWTGAGGSRATVSSTGINGYHYDIDSSTFNAKVKSYGTILWQDSIITVGEYLNIGIGSIEISKIKNYPTVTWGTSYIP